jgi:hypothetical protein
MATLAIRVPLSPPLYLCQLYEQVRVLPRYAHSEQCKNLMIELAALAAADKEEEREKNGLDN